MPQVQLIAFLLAISLNTLNKKLKKKKIQGYKNPLLRQCLAQELSLLSESLQSVTLDAGLLENQEKRPMQLER